MDELDEILGQWSRGLWAAAMEELEIKTMGLPPRQAASQRKLHKLKRVLGTYVMKPNHHYSVVLRETEHQQKASNYEWRSAVPTFQEDWKQWAKTELHHIKEKLETERRRQAEHDIRTAVNGRNDMFSTNLKQMLDRILERKNKRIHIDKAQVEGGTEFDDTKVKQEVDEFMEK